MVCGYLYVNIRYNRFNKYFQVIYFTIVTATGYPNPIYDVVIVYDYLKLIRYSIDRSTCSIVCDVILSRM